MTYVCVKKMPDNYNKDIDFNIDFNKNALHFTLVWQVMYLIVGQEFFIG